MSETILTIVKRQLIKKFHYTYPHNWLFWVKYFNSINSINYHLGFAWDSSFRPNVSRMVVSQLCKNRVFWGFLGQTKLCFLFFNCLSFLYSGWVPASSISILIAFAKLKVYVNVLGVLCFIFVWLWNNRKKFKIPSGWKWVFQSYVYRSVRSLERVLFLFCWMKRSQRIRSRFAFLQLRAWKQCLLLKCAERWSINWWAIFLVIKINGVIDHLTHYLQFFSRNNL